MNDDAVYLRHILECIRRIEEDVTGGRQQFFFLPHDPGSESTQHLSAGLQARHPEVEWRRIAAFRNVLVHDYLGVDLERVWEILERDVPEFKGTVLKMLQEL